MTLEHLLLGKLSLNALPDDPITLYGAGSVLLLGILAVVGSITYFKKWGYIWREWICTVDHKKIGIMYVMLAFVMFTRGIVQAVMMRAQQAAAVGPGHAGYMDPTYYNQFFF